MGFDPATAAAVATVAGKVAGDKQLGGIAPSGSTIGASPPSGLLGDLTEKLGLPSTSGIAALSALSGGSSPLEEALGKVHGNATGLPPKGPDRSDFEPPPESNPLSDFLGGLDKTLTSPSKQIGLGLLSQLDPKLGLAGLLAGGLLGPGK